MQVERKRFMEHLAKIHANGQIKEAVLHDSFACNALNGDGQLMVMAPSLKGVEPLPDQVGVTDVALLRSFIKSVGGEGEQIGLEFKDAEIHLGHRHGGQIEMKTALPHLINSVVKPETVSKVVASIPKGAAEFPLSQATIQGVQETSGLIKPEIITLQVGKKGSTFVVGQSTGHIAKFPCEAKCGRGQDDYELIFSAKLLLDAFAMMHDYTATKIQLTGPDSMVVLSEGAYKYVVSPQEPA